MATLSLRIEGLNKLRKLAKIDLDADLAARIGVDPATVSRVLGGRSAPGPKFIAGLLSEFGNEWFEDLFSVIPTEDKIPA